ncbi:MAG: hypothetical protein ACSLFB_06525 [Acidimicrobiales bacterium]
MSGRQHCVRKWLALAIIVLTVALATPVTPATAAIGEGPGRGKEVNGSEKVAHIESPNPKDSLPTVPEGRFGPSEPASKRKRGVELTEERTAISDAWSNSDGTRSIRTYAVPHYYQPQKSSKWVPIDMELASDESRPGRVRSKANQWAVSFGPAGSSEGMQQFHLDGPIVSFSPVGADPSVKPLTKDSTATYTDMWPATEAIYAVSAVGVDERLVLKSPSAPTSFTFEVAGASPKANGSDGIDLVVGKAVVASIPPLTVEVGGRAINPAKAGATFSVKQERQSDRGQPGGSVTISISKDWLANLPAKAFPVVIDPTVIVTTTPTQITSFSASAPSVNGTAKAGTGPGLQTWRGAAYLPIPNPASISPGGSQPWHLVDATMEVVGQSGSLTGYPSLSVLGEPLQRQLMELFSRTARRSCRS